MASGFVDKTPEEMDEISKCIPEGTRRYYANRTLEQIAREKENKRAATQVYWDNVSPEKKDVRLKTSFHNHKNGYDCLVIWNSQLENSQALHQTIQAFV